MRRAASLLLLLGGTAAAAEGPSPVPTAAGPASVDASATPAAAPIVGPVAAPVAPQAVATDEAQPPDPSKKERFLEEKAARRSVHARRIAAARAHDCLTVRNAWTHEILPVDPKQPPGAPSVDDFLRDHFTNQATRMDPRLSAVILRAAAKFKARFVEIVSGYRAPKYNLMLRKKGHAVARESQHPLGHAVDFRLVGVTTKQLYRFVRSLHLGGVGYYPHTGFVHADVGPVRTWKGE